VTANIRTIESIPLTLRATKQYAHLLQGATEVRGEIVMYKADFAALNAKRAAEDKPLYANPRNTAAGTIRQLDTRMVAARKLYFRAYDLRRPDAPDATSSAVSEIPTHSYAYDALRSLGFLANADAKVMTSLKQIEDFIHHWEDKRHELPFNT